MTAGELMDRLQKCDRDDEVLILYEDYAWAEIQFVDLPDEAYPHVTIAHSCVLAKAAEEQEGEEP